jgi:hypothetical protein
MRHGAAALLGALLFSTAAKAEQATATPLPIETVNGECSHPDISVIRWLRLIDDASTASYSCEAATLDWDNRLTFYRDGEASKAAIAILGHRGSDGGFTVTAVKPSLLPESPALGRCQMIAPENAGARRVLCYAKENGDIGRVHLVDMLVAEREWAGTAAIAGRCSAPGIGEYVLVPWIAELTGAEPDLHAQSLPGCEAMTVVLGQSFAFATGADGDGVTFLGAPQADRPGLLRISAVVLPGGARHAALAGGCLPKREADGHVVVLCTAAYADGGVTKYVEIGFIPKASRFEWPPATLEPEPLP